MLWHEHSWPQIDAMDRNTPVIIPLGSCEQHGHHLPVLVDTIEVTAIAERVEAEMCNEVLLTPTLWIGSSHHHKDFPGTVSLSPSLYSDVIKGITSSVLDAGFRRVFFLNGHGGNDTPASQALAELIAEDERASDAYLVFSSWWSVARDAMQPDRYGMTTPFISHACEYETSLMLALRPELVDMERVREAGPVLDDKWFSSEYARKVRVFRRYARLTASGNMGLPSAATAEKGQALLEALVREVISFVQDFRRWPDLPVLGPA